MKAFIPKSLILISVVGLLCAVRAFAEDITLDDPNGSKNLGNIDSARILNISGRIGTLTIGSVNGRSTIDIDGLEAKSVQFGLIDGGSNVNVELKIIKGKGTVTFNDRIDGRSTVTVCAGGNVSVSDRLDGASSLSICTWRDVHIGHRVDCGATLTVSMCRNLTVGDRIDNPNTTANVTYYGNYSAHRANGNVNPKQVQRPKKLPCDEQESGSNASQPAVAPGEK